MEVTKLSTKGQIVIPKSVRRNFEVGTPFTVVKKGDLIILKEIEGLSKEELKEMEELDKIWKDIDSGKGKSQTKDEFLKEMSSW